jgi:CelD/BcsL family acetyltransferase involved in cellulose biosynthesis
LLQEDHLLACRSLINPTFVTASATFVGLASRPEQGFQSPGWLPVLMEQDKSLGRCILLASFDEIQPEKTRVLLPLSIGREKGLNVARILGESLAQYADCSGPTFNLQDWKDLSAHLRTQKVDLLILRRVREDSALWPVLRDIPAFMTEPAAAPFFDLSTLVQHRPKALRESRRLRRRLEERYSCSFSLQAGADAPPAFLEQAFAWKQQWAKTQTLPSRFISESGYRESLIAFFTAPETQSRIGIFSLDGEAVAIEAGFLHQNRFYAFLGAYHPDWRNQGVGSIVMGEMLQSLHEAGVAVYDQLAPADPYKLLWSKSAVAVHDVIVPLSLCGKLRAQVLDANLLPFAKTFTRRLPAPVRRIVLTLAGRG